MRKFFILINHDRGEYSVVEVQNTISALDAIAVQKQKGRHIEYIEIEAVNMEAAKRISERQNENYHCVDDCLTE
jgi:hypothetical protein